MSARDRSSPLPLNCSRIKHHDVLLSLLKFALEYDLMVSNVDHRAATDNPAFLRRKLSEVSVTKSHENGPFSA